MSAKFLAASLDDDLFLGFRLGYGEAFLKITRQCNNKCRFCCDSTFQDGHAFPREQALATLDEGRRRGLCNVVFSGGEPTLHPDFLSLLEAAGQRGYTRISVITNGRYFAYKEVCRRAIRAGMTTAVITLLSDEARVHDYLCGTPGAFEQSLRAIRNLVSIDPGRVSVVVTVTRPILAQLPRIVRFLHRLGVSGVALHRVAPLPWVAADPEVFFEPEVALQPLRRAIAIAGQLGLPLAVKNFPPRFLERQERLITEAEEFFPEVRDTERHLPLFHSLVTPGTAPYCGGLACGTCYRQPFCDYLRGLAERWRSGDYDIIRVSPVQSTGASLARVDGLDRPLSLAGAPLERLLSFARERAWLHRIAHLELDDAPSPGAIAEFPGIRSVTLRRTEGLLSSLHANPDLTHILLLNARTRAWVEAHIDRLRAEGDRAVLMLESFERLRDALAVGVNPRAFFGQCPAEGLTLMGFPRCVAPAARHVARPRVLDTSVLDDNGLIDPLEACHAFLREGWLDRSVRCSRCPDVGSCDGLPINTLIAFGYEILQPRHPGGRGSC